MEVRVISEAEATIDCCCCNSGKYQEYMEPPEDTDPEEEPLESDDPEGETLEDSDPVEDLFE